MGQKLIYPFVTGMTICGYKTEKYKSYWGYTHYGIDITSIQGIRQPDNYVRASGEGTVVWCVRDVASGGAKSLGWSLAVQYNDCISHGGITKSLIVRYMHSDKCYVVKGQKVRQGDILLLEGKVGTNGEHVHFEIDEDTRYPQYTPQVSGGHSGWYGPDKGARDSTLNPSYWLWQNSQYRQIKYAQAFTNRAWINEEDDNLPFISGNNDYQQQIIIQLQAEVQKYKKSYEDLKNGIENLIKSF